MSSEERDENRNPNDVGMEIFIPSERRFAKKILTREIYSRVNIFILYREVFFGEIFFPTLSKYSVFYKYLVFKKWFCFLCKQCYFERKYFFSQ